MNNAKFNTSPFNSAAIQGDDVSVKMTCYVDLNAIASFGKDTSVTAKGSISLNTVAQLAAVIPDKINVSTSVMTDSKITSVIVIDSNCNVLVNTRSYASKDMYSKAGMETEILTESYLSKDIWHGHNFDLAVNTESYASKDMVSNLTILSTNLMTVSKSTIFEGSITEVDVSLKYGDVLVIDSNDYTAYIADENVLWAYDGDWVILDRDLTELTLESAAGGELEATIIYREAFL